MVIKRGSREELLSEYYKELYKKEVVEVEYKRLGLKTTVCLLTARNGFEVVGTSACVNPLDYDERLGKFYALSDALNKLDGFIGFLRQEKELRGE
jgi:hypothetical protein